MHIYPLAICRISMEAMALSFHLGQIFNGSRQLDEASVQMGKIPRFQSFPQDNGHQMAVCQNLVPLVNIKIAGKWMFIPLKMVLIGIDPSPNVRNCGHLTRQKNQKNRWIDLENLRIDRWDQICRSEVYGLRHFCRRN